MATVKRVLVATDGSGEAAEAIEWLAAFPLPSDVTVEAVTVDDRHAKSERVLEDARGRLAKRWPDVAARVLDGDPREAIVGATMKGRADLIVLGARGLGTVASFVLGSVSLGVTRYAPCPVLVCRGAPRRIRSATVAFDGSIGAKAALEFFSALPLPQDLRVRLVGVATAVRRPSSAPAFLAPALRAAAQQLENEARRTLELELEPIATALRPHVGSVVTATPAGAPVAAILREAETDRSDLIVAGARGLGMLERVALGSASEAILRQATCPVLVVRPRP